MNNVTNINKTTLQERIRTYEKSLTEKHGPTMSGSPLRTVLGYRTAAAFRQAIKRDKLPVPLFKQEKRRGYFARTIDIATWLAEIDETVENMKKTEKSET